jgi:dinuclear metal center YbgI/SA1388 family protein
MTINELIKYFEDWAPPKVAWEKDNVGLQVGKPDENLQNVLLCLELNEDAVNEAIENNCNLIFTHHPFLFSPLKRINLSKDPHSKLLEKLIKNDITLYSAHTNLDFAKYGVSFVLAEKLGLQNIEFLVNQDSNQVKLTVFTPPEYLDEISGAVFEAGGGIIGEYGKCSYRLKGQGTFEGSENTNPAYGERMNFETVDEYRFEVIVDSWKINKVVAAMLDAHPYEEPAYDIYPLNNTNVNFGFGAIGELKEDKSKDDFLVNVCKSLETENLRYTNGKNESIRKVAVCGGSGSQLLETAVNKGADAFITADIKYHTFQDAENRILLADAGHYETEIHVMNRVKERFEKFIDNNFGDKQKPRVLKFSGSTNPIKFFNKKGVS